MPKIENNPERFEVFEVKNLVQVRKHWPLFLEGLGKLNSLQPGHEVTAETYFRVISDAIMSENGLVFLVKKHGEGNFLFYCIALDDSSPYGQRSLLVYAAYSTHESGSVTRYALEWVTQWAKEKGYKEMHAWSPRINGSAFHLFEQRWGFRRRSILFTKSL